MKRRNIHCRTLILLLLFLSSLTIFIEVANQILHEPEEREHLATCFGPMDANFTVVTIGENFAPSLREGLLENKRSWSKKHNAQMCWYFTRIDHSRGTAWNKILATLHAMRCVAKKDSYILTLDADAVVRNADTSPDDILKEIEMQKVETIEGRGEMNAVNNESPHIFWSSDYHVSSPINTGAFLCVNSKNSEHVLKKIYDHLHGITFYRAPHWNDQVGVHNYLRKCKDEFDSTSAIVSSDIFNQHASKSSNASFIAHFAGMGRSQTKYTEIVKEMHLWAQNERNVNLVSIYQTSEEEHWRNFYRKRSPIFDSFFFTKVLRRFKMAKAEDFDILDDCSS